MDTALEKLIDELSLQLLMLDQSNPEGALEEIAQQLQHLIDKCAMPHQRLQAAGRRLLAEKQSLDVNSFLDLLNTFITRSQLYLKNPALAVLPGEEQEASDSKGSKEISDDADQQLLVEFIEKHTGMMEDLEAAILDFRQALCGGDSTEARSDFACYVKGYVHNIKGDAGSVGLIGIAESCHFVEDVMLEHPADTILEPLLSFEEWVCDCMRAITAGKEAGQSSASFREMFKRSCAVAPERNQVSQADLSAAETKAAHLPSAADMSALLGENLPPETMAQGFSIVYPSR